MGTDNTSNGGRHHPDHVWTISEPLFYRVPAKFLDQLPKIKPLFALVHQGN